MIPDGVDDERALFVGDIATTARYVAGLAAPAADQTVAVVGVGPVGLLVVQALAASERDGGRAGPGRAHAWRRPPPGARSR